MQDAKKNYLDVINRTTSAISIPAIVLCVVLALIISIAPVLPSPLTRIFRPLVILICFIIPGKYAYKANNTIWAFGIYLFYMTLVFLSHSSFAETFDIWMSAMLFGAFFVVVSQRMWGQREINLIIITVFVAATFYAGLLHYYNHDLLRSSGDIAFRSEHVNTNAGAYTVAPGALCGVCIFLFSKKRGRHSFLKKLIILAGIALCFYTLICLGSRGGFFTSTVGAAAMIWEKCGSAGSNKSKLRVLLVLAIAVGLVVAPRLTEGTHAERLFDYENLTDDNGRDDLNDRAIELIHQKPIFGGGYGYWESESGKTLGLHNGFLYIMCIGGYTAGILLGAFFIYLFYETAKTRSFIPIAFLFVAILHMLEDSGLDYFSYIPMIISYVMIRNAQFRKYRVSDVIL